MNGVELIDLIRNDRWDRLIGLIENKEYNMDEPLLNGNNTFHIACIRLNEDFMRKYFSSKIRNVNRLNVDGITGLQLYYKYGGNSIEFLENDSICYHDVNGNTAIIYINDENMVVRYLENAIKNNCLNSILHNDVIQHTLYDNAIIKKHWKVIDILIQHINPINVIYHSILLDDYRTIGYLIDIRSVDPMIRNKNNMTPLIVAVNFRKHDTIRLLLQRIEAVHSLGACYQSICDGGYHNNMNPLLIAIKHLDMISIEILCDTVDRYFDKYIVCNRIFHQCDQFLNNAGHLLIRVLTECDEEMIKKWEYILIRVIRYTDLRQENYSGTTVMHLLFSSGLWKIFNKNDRHSILAEKKIDVLHLDENGNTIYTYINKEDYFTFMEFMGLIGITIDLNLLKGKKHTDAIKIMNPQNYGKFNANLIHNMIYMAYLMKTYPKLYIPSIPYNRSNRKFRSLTNKMLFYKTSYTDKTFYRIISQMNHLFYRYTPHYILWGGKDHYHVDHDLEQSLVSDMGSDTQFVLIKITIIIAKGAIHSNMALYCKKTKVMRRFEPTGLNNVLDGNELDMMLKGIFEKVYGDIRYLRPEDYMTCSTFQLTTADDNEYNKNLGDPYGYCLAWSIWFVEMRLRYPEADDYTLYRNAIDRHKVNMMIGMNDPNIRSKNYYLDYIRNYANDLDEIKNKLMLNIGIPHNEHYMLYPSTNTLKRVKNIFVKSEF